MVSRLSHTHDPITSHEAAARLKDEDLSATKEALLELLAEEPRATFQLTDAYFNLREENGWPDCKPDGIAKRLSDLHNEKRIRKSGRHAISPFDRRVTIWCVADVDAA